MPSFLVRVRAKGSLRTIEINADGPEAARRQGRRYGSVLGVSQKRRAFGRGMNITERYTFMVRLATMLGSQVGGTEALRLLRDSFTGRISECAGGLLEKVESGVDLPTAIGEDKRNFPGPVGLIVKVGAQTGQLYRSLQEAAEFEQKINQVKQTSGRGIVSGIFGFFVAGTILVFSTYYISPKVMSQTLIKAKADSLNLAWIDHLAVGGTVSVVTLLVVLFGLFWLATVGRLVAPLAADAIILRIPYYREIVLAHDNYIALRRLSLLIRAGVRVEEALSSSVEATKPGQLKEDLKRALQALKAGQKWSHAMKTLHPTDRAALALAADREQIGKNLDAIAEQYQNLYAQRVATFGPVLQMISAVAVSLAGFVLFGHSVLPMLQVSAAMLK